MTILAFLAPLLLAVGLLASGRVGTLGAGAAGLAATVAVLPLSPAVGLLGRGVGIFAPPGSGIGMWAASAVVLVRESAIGGWLAWQAIAVILGGVLFYHCVRARGGGAMSAVAPPTAATDATVLDHRRLWFACFLLGPFAECATGFGVGAFVALAFVARLGLPPLPTLLFGLYSQILVPWGGSAIGTAMGAALTGLPPGELGRLSALLQAPMHALYLALFWALCARAGRPATTAAKFDDAVWTAATVAAVYAANLALDVEIAGTAPLAALAAARWLRDERPDRRRLRETVLAALPYVVLVAALVASRVLPPMRDLLRPAFALAPFAGQPVFSPLYNPGVYLAAIGVLAALTGTGGAGRLATAAGAAARAAWRPCAVTLLFVVMARLHAGSGMAQALADALHDAAGSAAVLASPVFAGTAGFLTASTVVANSLVMPLQFALGQQAGGAPAWSAAVQNAVAANLTLLSPIRVAMALSFFGGALRDRDVYRAAWPLALPALVVGSAASVAILAAAAP